MKNKKISTRIMSGFLLVFVFMAAIVVSGVFISGSIRRGIDGTTGGEGTDSIVITGIARDMKFDVAQVHQWLTDISATQGKDGLDDGKDKAEYYRNEFKSNLKKLADAYTKKKDRASEAKLDEIDAAFDIFYTNGVAMADAYISGGPESGNKAMKAFDDGAETLAKSLDPFVSEQDKLLGDTLMNIHTAAVSLQYLLIILGAVGLVVCIGTGMFTAGKITAVLRRILDTLRDSASQVSNASSQLSTSSQHLSEASTEQASTVEQISASIVQISSMTANNAESSQEANTVSTEAKDAAQKGNTTMMSMVDAMTRIQESSSKTSKIIKTIDEIAFQTNLLALNAAVEAARAGEAGKGFAVVAEEVRNLAQRSSDAAKNTTELLEGAIKNTADGVKVAEDLTWALTDIISGAARVNEIVSEIAQASKEQANGIAQVSGAINQMEKAVQTNSSTAEESASAANELFEQARTLEEAIDDLVSLVGTAGNGAVKKAPVKRPPQKVHSHVPRPPIVTSKATGLAPVAVSQTRGRSKVDPEDLIPFKDGGFEDF